jgi:hypothetical protein
LIRSWLEDVQTGAKIDFIIVNRQKQHILHAGDDIFRIKHRPTQQPTVLDAAENQSVRDQ